LFIGLSSLVFVFSSVSWLSFLASMVLVILGVILHFVSGYRDPDISKLVQQHQETIKERDKNVNIVQKRNKSMVTYVLSSLVSGAALTGLILYASMGSITEIGATGVRNLFLIGTSCLSSLFILVGIYAMFVKRAKGEW
jgi:hypothetical protein